MSKMNCQSCTKAMESRSMSHCKGCNAYMCTNCHSVGSGYCNECQHSMEMYD